MGTVLFSIPPNFVVPKKTLAAPKTAKPPGKRRRSTRGKATIQWEAADGTTTGAPIALHVPPAAALEYPDSSGRMGWTDTPASLSFSDEPPEDAVALRLSVPGKAAVKIPRAALTAKTALGRAAKADLRSIRCDLAGAGVRRTVRRQGLVHGQGGRAPQHGRSRKRRSIANRPDRGSRWSRISGRRILTSDFSVRPTTTARVASCSTATAKSPRGCSPRGWAQHP